MRGVRGMGSGGEGVMLCVACFLCQAPLHPGGMGRYTHTQRCTQHFLSILPSLLLARNFRPKPSSACERLTNSGTHLPIMGGAGGRQGENEGMISN